MESLPKKTPPPSILTEDSPLDTSAEIRRKAKEERQRQLQCLLEGKPIEEPTQESIEEEVNRLMEEVELHEKNYIPKDIEHSLNDDDFDFMENEENDKNFSEKKNNNIINTNSKKNIKKNEIKKNETKKNETKKNPDLDLDMEDLEDIIEENYYDDNNNNKNNSQKEDKELKELLNLYEKQLDKDIKEEVELNYKPSVDPNDVKRADNLLQKDKLLNTAVIQGIISREELIMYVDYYEIFSLMNKSKKFTQQHLQAIEDLCIKNNENKNNNNDDNENDDEDEKKDVVYDNLNHEDAINKLTDEIEKKLESSEDILNKKMEFLTKVDSRKNDNLKNILEKYKNKETDNNNKSERNIESAKSDISNITNKTGFTNYTNCSNNNQKTGGIKFNQKKIKVKENNNDINTNIIKKDDKLSVDNSTISEFTTEELMSVPKYISVKKEPKKEKSDKKQETNIENKTKTNFLNKSTISSSSKKTNNNISNNTNISFPRKSSLPKKNILKNSNNDNNNSILSLPSGKKTIAPINQKSCRNPITNSIKSNPKVNLFDDNANPINLNKLRGTRKELVKLKMGNKSKMHELFSEKPRNLEENEILKQKFMDFILSGKENNKNPEMNALKKSIVRKKIEDAQNFNKKK